MEQTTRQIETHIENTRDELGSNLHELERKVKSVTDWKEQFQKNPMLILSAAFGGGILVASMMSGNRSRRNEGVYSSTVGDSKPHASTDRQSHKALQTWDNIKGALIGVAVTRFKNYVAEVVPEFQEQYRKTEEAEKTGHI
jgi:hypothetical protein